MRAGARHDLIDGRLDLARRGKLLKRRLGVLRRSPLHLQVRLPHPEDEALSSLEPAVEEQGAD
jgi:hypothetical protein